jgi:hypothetical protein
MAVVVAVDLRKSKIKETHATVSDQPEQDFGFPTGRPGAEGLVYSSELANVPEWSVGVADLS